MTQIMDSETGGLSEYELQRLEMIKENRKMLDEVRELVNRPVPTITNYDIIGGQNQKEFSSRCIDSLNTAFLS